MINLKKLAENYEKGDPIVFRDEMMDHRAGESFMTLSAYSKEEVPLGKIDYSIYQNEIAIKYIKTSPTMKRKGIATAMAKELQRLHPDTEIDWGSTTDDGSKFLEKLPRTYTPNKRYTEIVNRLRFLNKKKDALDRIYNEWHALYDRDKATAEKLRPKINSLNNTFQRVYDEIWELEQELIPMKQGTWKVNLSEEDDEEESIDKDRLFYNDNYLEQVATELGYEPDFTKKFWGMNHIPYLYHCTTPENYELIKVQGLKKMKIRRGAVSGNSSVGPSVFTTMEEEEVPFFSRYYGDVVIKINAQQMKNDGFMPIVEQEPDWTRGEMLEFVLRKLGDDQAEAERYMDGSDQNTRGTVIVYSDIPLKYLSLQNSN